MFGIKWNFKKLVIAAGITCLVAGAIFPVSQLFSAGIVVLVVAAFLASD